MIRVLTDDERRFVEIATRTVKASRMLGLDVIDRLLIWAMVEAKSPWSVSALAVYVNEPRSTIQRRITRCIADGSVKRVRGGVTLTEFGRHWAVETVRETHEIVLGLRQGFSADLVTRYEKRAEAWSLPRPQSGIKSLSFPRI